ncbi:type I polyketide synthase [Thiocapsa bogorovii]|uniref:type I polyketide synthase n=1 Tax=Thiocapsa bogorovii TaxID=521689 RepID=UPI001E2E6D49|nr:type I polyketide synthase [Thiocapsa bogorovii]UHD14536.1 SDR family NAD(P)-dependent oxidoreductase [Thiocapsa bogorovii]
MKHPIEQAFVCLCLNPAELPGGSILPAAARAGHLGVLDLTRCGHAAFTRAVADAPPSAGLRLRPEQVESVVREASVQGRPLLIADADLVCADRLIDAARVACKSGGAVWIEIPSVAILDAVRASDLRPEGLIVRGQESAGWCGETGAPVLLQAALAVGIGPVIVYGGLGIGGMAACRAAGAAGVVLDDQLLLLRESPLGPEHRGWLETQSVEASLLLGSSLKAPCRVLQQSRFRQTKPARDLAIALEGQDIGPEQARAEWRRSIGERLGFGSPETALWPVGQGLGFAERFAREYRTLGRLLRAIENAIPRMIETAATQGATRRGSTMAGRLGVADPVVQGPMTRVSDTAEFADAVAGGGALPTLALGVMRPSEISALLGRCRERLAGRAWGVGLLGFIEPSLLEAQIECLRRIAPSYVVLAGGRPDQAKALEAIGLKTFVHVPTPALLERFLGEGVRRLIFEGRECGGHVGPIGSLPLWEMAVERILASKGADIKDLEVLFAGGIHDAASAAMAATVAAPLVARGAAWGMLMGTAYLYTREAVDRGAVVAGFQHAALACRRTVTIESAPGHANRCIDTPFVDLFLANRRTLLQAQRSIDETREQLDALLLGRLRIATKGIAREGERLIEAPSEQQQRDGMFMIGDCAVVKDELTDITRLHRSVTEDAARWLEASAAEATALRGADSAREAKPSDIAIIGIGMLAPGAADVEALWDVILAAQPRTREIPAGRWDWRLYHDPEGRDPDASVCRWGGFFDPVLFDPLLFGIPPKSVGNIIPAQLLMLEMTRRALLDAGYPDGDFDREETAVIFGAADAAGFTGDAIRARAMAPVVAGPHAAEIKARTPELADETFAGGLTSVVAGRVANRFDCGGPNLTVDAACASGLTALDIAVQSLESGRTNLALVGAVDVGQSPGSYTGFTRTGALSPTGTEHAFDASANGFVPSEAAIVMVLKRLADAERDGDRIYAVVKAVGASSDGRAMGMTAPRTEGQLRAMRRAYLKAAIPLSSIELYEAHGTGTRVGDQSEIEAYSGLLDTGGVGAESCTLGSLKSILGHAKTAAGLLGLAKTTLALYHGVLPPHYGVTDPIPALARSGSPLRLLDAPRPWLDRQSHPHRAAVSAFGFGGTNSHVVLEEYRALGGPPAPCGGHRWPAELFVFHGPDRARLRAQLTHLQDWLARGAKPPLRTLAAACAQAAGDPRTGWVATAVVPDLGRLADALAGLMDALDEPARRLPSELGLEQRSTDGVDTVAFLFPGQGAQYVGMGRALALHAPPARAVLSHVRARLEGKLPLALDDYLFPPSVFNASDRARLDERLIDTRVAQPAIGAVSAASVAYLQHLGVIPDMVAGHSFGELTALHAAGVLSLDDFIDLATARGGLMAAVNRPGGMAAVFAEREAVESELRRYPGIVLANHNSDKQVVISGPAPQLEAACAGLADKGWRVMRLRVSTAFHSPLMAEASDAFAHDLSRISPSPARIAAYSNIDGRRLEGPNVAAHLNSHLTAPVEFVAMVRRMMDAGARVFVDVGPMETLAGLLGTMDLPEDVRIVALDPGKQGMPGFLKGLAALWRAGRPIDLARLFDGRVERIRGIDEVCRAALAPPVRPTSWMVDGHMAWPVSENGDGSSETSRWRALKPLYDTDSLAREQAERAREATESARLQPSRSPLPAVGDDAGVAGIYQAYAETVQAFIASQERIFSALVGGDLPAPASLSQPASIPGAVARPSVTPASEPSRESVPVEPRPAPTSAPPAPSAPPSLDPTRILMETVSRVTGYPEDMLSLDDDMEAELGIDSLKRLEILESFARALPGAGTGNLDVDRLARIRTLRGWLESAESVPPVSMPPGGAQTTGVRVADRPVRADVSTGNTIDWAEAILRVASEVTGYPADMLDLTQDIEADLGIDSLKRIEMADRLREEIAGRADVDIHAFSEDLTRLRHLGEWVSRLSRAKETTQPTTPSKAPSAAPPRSTVDACPRYVMAPVEQPLSTSSDARLSGLYIVTRDRLGVAEELAALLELRGAYAGLVEAGDDLDDTLAALRSAYGPVQGIVHLAGLDQGDHVDWADACRRSVLDLFRLLQAVRSDFARSDRTETRWILSASALGGRFGRDGRLLAGSPVAAAPLGILRSLEHEWPSLHTRCLDFERDRPPLAVADTLVNELLSPGGATEVGYLQGERWSYSPRPAPLAHTDTDGAELPQDAVILATGGARGITASLVCALARPGMRVVLIGRQALEDASASDGGEEETPAEIRTRLIHADRAAGRSRPPAVIEREVGAVVRHQEAVATLRRLRASGIQVEYHACDVRDSRAFGALIEALQTRLGRIDLLLHGAGVIEDRLLVDKTPDSIARVFETKAKSAHTLMARLDPERLGTLVLFASTAGRFGNRGQSDYAAANETLNRLAWMMRAKWPQTRILAINWGPWTGVGMADAKVQERFARQGIPVITPEAGARFLIAELAAGASDVCEVIAGDGPWGIAGKTRQATDHGASEVRLGEGANV